MESSETCIGFYSLNETQRGDGYLAAMLITDARGRPLEFRVTHPVKPSPFQRPLYGDALEPFIGIELCGERLLTRLDHEPDLLIVSHRYLLDIRELIPCPVMYAEPARGNSEVESDRGDTRNWVVRTVTSSSGRFDPIALVLPRDRANDFERAQPVLKKAFKHMDLLEPLGRISRALELLAEEDERFA